MSSFIGAARANLIIAPIGLVLSMVASIVVARQLGPEGYADYATILALVSWLLLLVEAGGNTGFARFLNEAGQADARATLYRAVLRLRWLLGACVIVALVALGPLWAAWAGLAPDRWSVTLFALIGLMAALGLHSQLAYYGLLASFMHRQALVISQGITVLRAGGICLVVVFVAESPAAIAALLVAVACVETAVFHRVTSRLFAAERAPLRPGMVTDSLRHGLVAVIDKITTAMGGGAFLLIVLAGHYGRAELAMLGIATDLLQKALSVAGMPVSNLVMPLLNARRDQPEQFRTAVARLIGIASLLLFAVLGGVAVFLPSGIPLLFGEAYRDAVALALWFLVPLFFESWVRMTVGSALLTLDRYRLLLGVNAVSIVLVVVAFALTYDRGLTAIIVGQGLVRLIMGVAVLVVSQRAGLFRLAWLPGRALLLVCLAIALARLAETALPASIHPAAGLAIGLVTYSGVLLGLMRWALELDREFVDAIRRLAGRHSALVDRFVRVKLS